MLELLLGDENAGADVVDVVVPASTAVPNGVGVFLKKPWRQEANVLLDVIMTE